MDVGEQPPADADAQLIRSAWLDQATWSATAGNLKAGLGQWRARAAVAGVAGALLETLAATLPDVAELRWPRAVIALLGAVVLATVPYILRTKVTRVGIAEWVRARSVSEALKEEIYRFMLRVPPYADPDARASFVANVQAEKDKVQDLNRHAAAVEPPRKERPTALDIEGYVEQRVRDQIERYYRPKAKEYALTAGRLRDVEFGLGMLAVIMGAAASAASATGLVALTPIGAWVAVVTTAGAAVTAHIAAAGYDRQSITFFATAGRLAGARNLWRADPNRLQPARVAQFVDECEAAISSENEAWLAAWTESEQSRSG